MMRKRKLVQFCIVVVREYPFKEENVQRGIATAIGIDLGCPEWSAGRRLVLHPAVEFADDGYWRVTDLACGASIAVDGSPGEAILLAKHHCTTQREKYLSQCAVHEATFNATRANPSFMEDRTEESAQALKIRKRDHVEVIA